MEHGCGFSPVSVRCRWSHSSPAAAPWLLRALGPVRDLGDTPSGPLGSLSTGARHRMEAGRTGSRSASASRQPWPLAGDILPGLPPALKARLLAAFDLQVLWNKPGSQATVFVEITENTLQALPGILDPGQDGYDDTDAVPELGTLMWDLTNTGRCGSVSQRRVAAGPRGTRRTTHHGYSCPVR